MNVWGVPKGPATEGPGNYWNPGDLSGDTILDFAL
jgi:hypothetical protein